MIDPTQPGNDDPQGPNRQDANPLAGCLAVWLSMLCCVGAIVSGYFGRWLLAGGAFAVALLLWFLKGKPDPGLMAEYSERYGVDRSGDESDAGGPKT